MRYEKDSEKSLVEILSSFKIFSDFNYEQLSNILRYSIYNPYRKERVLYYQNDRADAVYFILSGKIRKVKWREDSTSVVLEKVEAGSFLGLAEIIFDELYLIDAITEEESGLLYIHKTNFIDLMLMDKFKKIIIKELARAYCSLHRQLEVHTPLQKIIRYIKIVVETFEEKDPKSNNYVINITQENLAEAIGVTRETVNKYLRQLQDIKPVKILRGRIEVLNLEKIKDIDF